jgi:lipopolysaccharide/colanic/teichoic acid biosynthesis glycosyltransferase
MNVHAQSLYQSFLHDAETRHAIPLSREQLRVRCFAGLMAVEGITPIAAVALAAGLTGDQPGGVTLNFSLLLAIYYVGLAICFRAYTVQSLTHWKLGTGRTYVAATLAMLAAAGSGAYLGQITLPSRSVFLGTYAIELTLLTMMRVLGNLVTRRVFRGPLLSEVLIVDGVEPGDSLILGDRVQRIDALLHQLTPCINDPLMLDRIGRAIAIYDRVVVVCPPERRGAWAQALKGSGVQAEILIPEFNELGTLGTGRCKDTSTLVIAHGMLGLRERALKRALDLSIALPSIVFLMPLLIVVAILIKLDNPGPIFFMQKRVGRGNKLFSVYKFRSMKVDRCDANGTKLTQRDDDRITRVGRFLRKTSIDELPLLLNIIAGNMSLVGPRPHATGATAGQALYWEVDDRYFHRHAAKPGLTGLAQVRGFRGNTETSTDLVNRLQADLEYLSGWSLWRDLAILLRTAKVVVHANAY